MPLVIAAENVNEAPMLIDTVFSLDEGFAGELGRLEAFDPDANERLVFELVSNGSEERGGTLTLLADGRLTASGLPLGRHVFEVRVVDAGGLVSIGRVTVVVSPADDGLPAPGVAETQTPPRPQSALPPRAAEQSAALSVRTDTAATLAFVDTAAIRTGLASVGAGRVEPVARNAVPASSLLDAGTPAIGGAVSPDAAVTPPALLPALPSPERLLELLDRLRTAIEESDSRELDGERVLSVVTTVGGITLAVGFAHWLLGSRLLLAATLSSLSLWRPIDPVPLLLARRSRDEGDEYEEEEAAANDSGAAADPGARRANGHRTGD